MITWMQRHKSWLIITVWISTIAFVGAGFVGWGQYSYGDKAGSVAKVGNVEISMGDLQKSYSKLYKQYNEMFQGNFDEEKAKSFGLQSQALKQLVNQALILNLAESYDLKISNAELLNEIKLEEFFYKDGVFNKNIYKSALSKNNLSIKEYEADLRKQLLIQKTFDLLPVQPNENEERILDYVSNIADKINYKILENSQIMIDTSDEKLKPFWEMRQHDFMSEVSYDISYIKHTGAIKKDALRTYIDFKKDRLSPDIKVDSTNISVSNNIFNDEILKKISELILISPYMKPIMVEDVYYSFKLQKINPSLPKTYEQAKELVIPLYLKEQKKIKLIELAQNSLATFKGKTTGFITQIDTNVFPELDIADSTDFLNQLFVTQNKRGFITLDSGKVVLYNILEQKMLTNKQENISISRLKSAMFSAGLINTLKNKYKTEIFIEGL